MQPAPSPDEPTPARSRFRRAALFSPPICHSPPRATGNRLRSTRKEWTSKGLRSHLIGADRSPFDRAGKKACNSQATSVTRLRIHELAVASRFVFRARNVWFNPNLSTPLEIDAEQNELNKSSWARHVRAMRARD